MLFVPKMETFSTTTLNQLIQKPQ